jgi:hypothetical protein
MIPMTKSTNKFPMIFAGLTGSLLGILQLKFDCLIQINSKYFYQWGFGVLGFWGS